MNNQIRHGTKAKMLALLLSMLLVLGLVPAVAPAETTGTLTVRLKADTYANLPADPAVRVTLYQLGEDAPDTKAGWRIDDAFSGYGILKAETSSELKSIADHITADIADKGEITGTERALAGGGATFDGLELGVYLGVLTGGPEGLEAEPFIVTVPSKDPETSALRFDYDVTLKDKCVTEATVRKEWNDGDNEAGKRPESLKVKLWDGTSVIKTVTLNDGNNWSAQVNNLPRYRYGKAIAYKWLEDDEGMPDGYELTDTEVKGTVTTLTNTYTPAYTYSRVEKVWKDSGDQDGIRPKSLTMQLSDGEKDIGTVVLNGDNNWHATINNLPKYADGEEIVYTWTEVDPPEGYELTDISVDGARTALTNTHTPETVSATVRKVWDDGGNREGIRPDSLNVKLYRNEIEFDSVTLNQANNWEATIDNLPKYEQGREFAYRWAEQDVPEGYDAMYDIQREGTVTTLTNVITTSATVRKVWDDRDNADGLRPLNLTVTLSDGQSVSLNAGNDWTATIDNLPRYANGQEIEYSWSETGLPEGYTLTGIETSGTVTTLTNTHAPEVTSATVRKIWNDGDNQDNIRPASLRVTLSNGTENVDTVTLNAGNGWTATVDNLPKYADGMPIAYSWIEERLPAGYALTGTTIDGTVTVLTNSHTPDVPTVEISGQKVWEDDDNASGVRPENITVQLYADGVPVNATPTWRGRRTNTWTYTFSNLPANTDSGAAIQYTVQETPVSNYEGSVSGLAMTNRLIPRQPQDYKEITGIKTWVEDDGAASRATQRPNYITVHLLRNGVEIATRTVTAATDWTYSFGMQPVDDGYGNLYEYEVREDAVPGYLCRVNGVNLINITLPRTPDSPDTPDGSDDSNQVLTRKTATRRPKFENYGEGELEDMTDIFDYGTPLWGGLLGTGDETPIYPYIFAGAGVAAVVALLVFGRKRKKRAK